MYQKLNKYDLKLQNKISQVTIYVHILEIMT